MLKLYCIGICILITAIVANAMIQLTGIKSWYDFIELLNRFGWKGFSIISFLDYLWLFLVYPLILGFGYWIGHYLYKTIVG